MPKGYTKKQLEDLYKSFYGLRQGHLTIIREATAEENKKCSGNAKRWLCQCDCGNRIFVKTAYIQGTAGRGDYRIDSCGCLKRIRHFISSSYLLDSSDEDWLLEFYKKDWNKFSFIHQAVVRTSGIKKTDWKDKEEYKNFLEYWWNDNQFNAIYNFWKQKEKLSTFYDFAKPSLDHKIPKSKGGTNTLDNLQFLTVFENLSKRDLTWEEWTKFKTETNTTSEYYIENIIGMEEVM